MSIQEYLETPLATPAGYVTPRRLIHEVASTEGAAHLGFRKSAQLELLKGGLLSRAGVVYKESELQRIMGQLTDWVLEAIQLLLCDSSGAAEQDSATGG